MALNGEALPLQKTYHLSGLEKRNEHLLHVDEVQFRGEGRLESGIFTVTGELTGQYVLSCARCLTANQVDFSIPFEERFHLENRLASAEDDDLEEIHQVEGNVLDLTPFIEQAVLLSIPYRPECSSAETCAQNIPQSGENWRVITEGEQRKEVDPRLADLAKFFDDDRN